METNENVVEHPAEVLPAGSFFPPSIFSQIKLLRLLAIATIPFCILSLAVLAYDSLHSPSSDLRNKIAGARLMAAGRSPYQPDDRNEYFSSDSIGYSTPPTFVLYMPLRNLTPKVQGAIYRLIDYIALAALFLIILRGFCVMPGQPYWLWILFAGALLCGFPLREELFQGQYYTFLTLLCAVTVLALSRGWSGWLVCVPTALLLLMRPTYGIILLVAYFCLGARKWTVRVGILTAAMLLASLYFGGIARWKEFSSLLKAVEISHYGNKLREVHSAVTLPGDSLVSPSFKEVIEGVNYSHHDLLQAGNNGTFTGTICVALRWLLHRFPALGTTTAIVALIKLNSAFLGVTLLAGAAMIVRLRRRQTGKNLILVFLLTWPLLVELFSPEKYTYAGVVAPLPLLILMLDTQQPEGWERNRIRGLLLGALAVCGVAVPALLSIVYSVDVMQKFLTVLILVVQPLLLALYCWQSAGFSPKRASVS